MEDFWEQRYRDGARQDYPWSQVVSFVMRHHDRTKPRGQTTVLEIGCGTGANLWFAAREGFRVIGFDASPTAIEHARARFKADALEGTFHVASFAQMQLGQASVDLVIDRASLTCVPLPQMKEAIAKVRAALRPGGVFLTTPYSATTVGINARPRPETGITLTSPKGAPPAMAGCPILTATTLNYCWEMDGSLKKCC